MTPNGTDTAGDTIVLLAWSGYFGNHPLGLNNYS